MAHNFNDGKGRETKSENRKAIWFGYNVYYTKMKTVGITGGIGSGKTTVCRIFKELDVPIYFADERAKKLMTENASLQASIIQEFGAAIYTDNRLNRALLAKKVFAYPEKLAALNALVHPVVAADFGCWLAQHSHANYVLKEAAILFESGANKLVDCTILVTAPEGLRIQRVVARDGVSANDVKLRMANQWTEKRKSELANHIVNNDGTQFLIPQVLRLHATFSAKS